MKKTILILVASIILFCLPSCTRNSQNKQESKPITYSEAFQRLNNYIEKNGGSFEFESIKNRGSEYDGSYWVSNESGSIIIAFQQYKDSYNNQIFRVVFPKELPDNYSFFYFANVYGINMVYNGTFDNTLSKYTTKARELRIVSYTGPDSVKDSGKALALMRLCYTLDIAQSFFESCGVSLSQFGLKYY